MSKRRSHNFLEILSIGVFLIIAALCLSAFSIGLIMGIEEALALIIGFYGVWMMTLAAIKVKKTNKYGRSPLSIFAWGLLTSVVGYGWYVSILGVPKLYVFSIALLTLGILMVVAAIQGLRKT